MSQLGDLRQEITTALAPMDINLYTHLSGGSALPSGMVLAGSPYMESGQTFGELTVRFEVWLSAMKGDNDSETALADEMLETAMTLLQADGWTIEQISQPFSVDINNGQAFTVSLIVTSPVTFPGTP